MKEPEEGFGSSKDLNNVRFFKENGTYNIQRKGSLNGIRDVYKYLISINWLLFLSLVTLAFIVINLIFTFSILFIGIEGVSGYYISISPFWNAFFFSIETFTTIGYGTLRPNSFGIHLLVVFESFISIISVAFITGLLYGRFSKPSSKILFSDIVLFNEHQGKKAVMFKMVNARTSVLLNAKVKVMLMLNRANDAAGIKANHSLSLELDSITFFPLTWTIVHSIDEKSPLWGMEFDTIMRLNAELIVLIEAFDETHSQSIFKIKSYAGNQWVNNRKFARSFNADESGTIVLDINSINELI